MIINSSQLSMEASSGHKDVSKTADGRILTRNHAGRTDPHFTFKPPDFTKLITGKNQFQSKESTSSVERSTDSPTTVENRSDSEKIIAESLKALTGSDPKISFPQLHHPPENQATQPSGPKNVRRFYHIGGQQVSLSFSSHKVHWEYEYLKFNSSGSISTGDGRNISFSLDLSVHRTTMVKQSIIGRAASGLYIDPLVLNFGSGIQSLSDQFFTFDLDGDGTPDKIPGLRENSGFLALDLNQDNKITNGLELFGPASGSGFADLAQYDLDQNRWIDENDPIFSKLLIWMGASSETQRLVTLKEAGVGAISLSHAGSQFQLQSKTSQNVGQVAASGIFLTENGSVHSLQDLKLALGDTEQGNAAVSNTHLEQLKSVVADHRQSLDKLVNAGNSFEAEKDQKSGPWNFWTWLRDDTRDQPV